MLINQRESQSAEINKILERFTKTGVSSIVYINGPPGTGKTYTLTEILKEKFPNFVYLNCSKLKIKNNIYSALIKCYNEKGKSFLDLKNVLLKVKEKICIVLDEIDLLNTKNQSIFYNLFELPYIKDISLTLFIIANTMNLSEMMLESKVRSRMGEKRINFTAYTSEQLLKISKSPKEMELAAKRIASLGGDFRKMHEIKKELTKKFGKEINIFQVNEMYNELFKPIYYSFLINLTVYQKLIIISLSKIKRSTKDDLFNNVVSFSIRIEIKPINYFEFIELVNMLCNQNILEKKKEVIILSFSEEEIVRALGDDEIYIKIFNNFA